MRTAVFLGTLLFAALPAGALAQAKPAQPAQADSLPANPVPVQASPFGTKQVLAPLSAKAPDDGDSAGTPEERCDRAEDRQKKGLPYGANGVDFKMFMSQMSSITQANWKPLMPKEVEKPFYKTGEVKVCFAILPSGQVEPESIVLKGRSGDDALDRAAWGAIQTSVYPRLPEDFKGPRLVVLIAFEYNKDRRPDPVKNLPKPPNPFGPVAVTVGYTSKL